MVAPDRVCQEYAEKKGIKKLTVTVWKADKEKEGVDAVNMVLIEGEAEALEFLGRLISAQAKFKQDCSFYIGPKTAGNLFFNKRKSTHGLYIHRLPCLERTDGILASP